MLHRPGLVESVRGNGSDTSTKSMGSATDEDKPVASGNGVQTYISLAEPTIYLTGFEQQDPSMQSTAMLRGSLLLRVSKSAKIKTVTMKFRGRATTDWPEGRKRTPWIICDDGL